VRGAVNLRGVTDVRTSVSTHGPVRPRGHESVHLQRFRLEMERRRLGIELDQLRKRAARLVLRLDEIDQLAADRDDPLPSGPAPPAAGWRRMTVGY
jgi:hypothetical protein